MGVVLGAEKQEGPPTAGQLLLSGALPGPFELKSKNLTKSELRGQK